MSRARSYATYHHGGGAVPHSSAPCYYYDEMEGYVGDYSESDGLSDGAGHGIVPGTPPDVTEIYRRKAVAPATVPAPIPGPTVAAHVGQMDYRGVYAPQEYYYEHPGIPQAPIPSRRAGLTYKKRFPLIGERPRYYSPESGELYDAVAFRSTHQMLPSVARNLPPPRVPSMSAVRQGSAKRHPITVRTPRFYRRPGSTTLYKRPSTLCLPVACQPDPAVYKRSKRSSSDQIYPADYQVYQQPQPSPQIKVQYVPEKTKHPSQKTTPQERNSNDYTDLNITKSKLDAALERYESMFEKSAPEGVDHPQQQRHPDAKLAQMLKPKIPQTIRDKVKEKHSKQNKASAEEKDKSLERTSLKIDWSKARVLEVEGAESDALEKILLADLKANGMAESDDLAETKSEKKSKSPMRSDKKIDKPAKIVEGNTDISLKDLPKSFNYQEIQNSVVKTKQHQQTQAELKQYQIGTNTDNIPCSKKCSRTDLTPEQLAQMSDTPFSRPTSAQGSQLSSKRQASVENLDKTSDCKSVRAGVVPRVLVDDALELHRTKSYVVNLIDHALSNHFGTNLCEKYSTKENPIDPKIAMELLKKHSACKANKGMCMEIAQALADTFNNSTTSCSTVTQGDAKQEASTCTCNKSLSEEPLYVKQLKQLRWGHLKHIQREVRRLEDLERFLDSCTSNNNFS